ncbi:DUF6515 family protein [Methylomonas sp. SURF-2]|uniref:DUF6515 family protein n=1 Tax=Methylomonas subterranea TaxID=2952225 RepID=A0ABT1TEA7_9GAMM|nr:DUF6515 family protein [Methylomonas sp. SURF-2]MCQ8103629.1 DUF6515 family protein [Methylomonas sp. SURF-2]
MKTFNFKYILLVVLLALMSRQGAVAGDWRGTRAADYRQQERHYNHAPAGVSLPRGYSRVYAVPGEYYYADGLFYRSSRHGYVAVAAPFGAFVNQLPRFKRVTYWQGRPYYVAGNTFYRRHANGYVVVPSPGREYRR